MEGKWGSNDVARALLFERLVDEQPFDTHERKVFRGHGREGVYASIRRELTRLLGTRCPVTGDEALTNPERTILEYGLPDLDQGGRNVINESDKGRIAKLIQHTIEAFEPRLRGVEVEVIKLPAPGGRLVVSIEGVLTLDNIMEPLSFTLPVGSGAEADANGG